MGAFFPASLVSMGLDFLLQDCSSMTRMDMDMDSYESTFTAVQPRNDVVPQVDDQRGMIQWINCDELMLTCHSLAKTTCELWTQCGDPRGRDYRQSCSQWHNFADINH